MLDEEIFELAKLCGIILKKAELEKNFEKIYSLVFQKMGETEDTTVEDFLLIFGAVGG